MYVEIADSVDDTLFGGALGPFPTEVVLFPPLRLKLGAGRAARGSGERWVPLACSPLRSTHYPSRRCQAGVGFLYSLTGKSIFWRVASEFLPLVLFAGVPRGFVFA